MCSARSAVAGLGRDSLEDSGRPTRRKGRAMNAGARGRNWPSAGADCGRIAASSSTVQCLTSIARLAAAPDHPLFAHGVALFGRVITAVLGRLFGSVGGSSKNISLCIDSRENLRRYCSSSLSEAALPLMQLGSCRRVCSVCSCFIKSSILATAARGCRRRVSHCWTTLSSRCCSRV